MECVSKNPLGPVNLKDKGIGSLMGNVGFRNNLNAYMKSLPVFN